MKKKMKEKMKEKSKTKENEITLFLSTIGESNRNIVLEFFIEGRELDYPMKFIAEEIDINRNTLYKTIKELTDNRMLKISRKIGSSIFYQLDLDNSNVTDLVELFDKKVNEQMKKMIAENSPQSKKHVSSMKNIQPSSEKIKYISKFNEMTMNTTKKISTA